MKKIITLLSLSMLGFYSTAQTTDLNYNEIGLMISDDNFYGSSRFNALSGSFGAIGGDLSAASINPAGAAVDFNSKYSITLGAKNINSEADFSKHHNNDNKYTNFDFNLSSANGSIVYNANKKWHRITLYFNYQMKNNFNNDFSITANYPYLYFDENPGETGAEKYDKLESQTFDRNVIGKSSVINIGVSGYRDNKLYVGGSFNFHSFNLIENVKLKERNTNKFSEILSALNEQEKDLTGNGISISLGAIYKLKNLRVGLAFETPTVYGQIQDSSNSFNQTDITDYFNGYTEIKTTDSNGDKPNYFKTQNEFEVLEYDFTSPLRLSTSLGWIIGKRGFINVDYTYKNYSTMNFEGDNFEDVNREFTRKFKNSSNLNIGGEWIAFTKTPITPNDFKSQFLVRAGYFYKKNPNTYTNNDISGFSCGFGINYNNVSLDLAYLKTHNKEYYNIYNNTSDLITSNNISRITGTLTFKL